MNKSADLVGFAKTFLGPSRTSVLRIEGRSRNVCTYFQLREGEGIQIDGAGRFGFGRIRCEKKELGG